MVKLKKQIVAFTFSIFHDITMILWGRIDFMCYPNTTSLLLYVFSPFVKLIYFHIWWISFGYFLMTGQSSHSPAKDLWLWECKSLGMFILNLAFLLSVFNFLSEFWCVTMNKFCTYLTGQRRTKHILYLF